MSTVEPSTHYLIDHDYRLDPETLHASMGHLLVYVPGERDAPVEVTIYFEEREPVTFDFVAPAGASTETNYTKWPVPINSRFALRVTSPEFVVCQSTVGWNNAGNDYTTGAKTRSPQGVRECARSYLSIQQLSRTWYIADGLVLNDPQRIWVRESEWAFLLNPVDEETTATLTMQYGAGALQRHTVSMPGRRLHVLYLDDVVRANQHYGIYVEAGGPIAAHWMRVVKWDDTSEIMTFWSVPCIPGPA